MPRILLAALALACVCSPAMAANLIANHASGGSGETTFGLIVGCGLIVAAVAAGCYAMRPRIAPCSRDIACVLALAAIFLAVPSAYAAECSPAPVTATDWLWLAGFLTLAFAYVAFDIWRSSRRAERERREWADFLRSLCWFACITCSAAALLLIGGRPALAAEVATVGDTAVILPWGDYLVATAQMAVQIMLPVILPALAAAVVVAIGKVAPWATLFLSQRRLEQMGQALADYGLNAVQGAAKGKTLSVDIGSRVIAAGVNYGLEKVPPKVVDAAGGAEGLAKIIFRLISMDERATASAVIPAAMEKLHLPAPAIERPASTSFPPPTADELRDAERMSRG